MKTKRFLLSIAILAAGLTSCSRSDALDGAAVTGETSVAVSAVIPAELNGARSGEGSEINRCQMEIYLDGVRCGDRQVAEVTGGRARFEAHLVAGKTYDFVFWADAAENGADVHYDTRDLSNVVVKDADTYAGNDETRDAFFGKETVKITAAAVISAQLRRPFGQLNVKTNDMEIVQAVSADLVPTHVAVKFTAVPTGINLLTGELLAATDAVAYAEKAAVIDANGMLSMDYIFAPKGAEQYLADFTMSFFNASGAEAAADYTFTNIPIQRNYRTNVSGNLLTKKADMNVELAPAFDGEIDHEVTEAATVAEANAALASGARVVSVTEAPTEDAELILPSVTDEIAVILPELTNKLTVKYVDGITAYPVSLSLTTPSSADLVIETPNTTVTLNGASYANVSSSTADNTLIVGEDVTIDNLTLVKGSVEVYGTVKKVVKKNTSSQIILHAGDGSKLVAFKEGMADADKENFFKSVNRIVLDADIDFAGAEFKIEALNGVSIDGQGHKIANFKAENVQCAGLICNAISVKVYNLTVAGANIKAVNDGAGNAYAGAVIGRSYGKIVFDNCTVDGCTIEGVNKVGGMIGFVAENNIEAKDCKVLNSRLSTENVPDESGQIGGFAGYIGSQYNSICLFENCSAENCTIDVYMGELAPKRAFGKFIGCMQGSEATDILNLTGCSVENVVLNRLDDNARNYLSAYGDMLGGMRNANGKVNMTDCDTNIKIETAGQFCYFASMVNGGNKNFAGKTVELTADIDLDTKEWTPISSWDGILNGLVLDGKGHTVSNMSIQGTAENGSLGLFSTNASSMTVKNLIFDHARIIDKTDKSQHYAGVVMGKNYSTVTFENISVKNSVVINNWQCGGLCGFAEGIAPVFERCSIADSFVGGDNATCGTLFGLGIVDVTGRGCSATNVKLYTDGLTWDSTQKKLGNYFVGDLYGRTLDAADYVETGVTVVSEYPEEYK